MVQIVGDVPLVLPLDEVEPFGTYLRTLVMNFCRCLRNQLLQRMCTSIIHSYLKVISHAQSLHLS